MEGLKAVDNVSEYILSGQNGGTDVEGASLLLEAAAGHADDPGLLDQAKAPAVEIQYQTKSIRWE